MALGALEFLVALVALVALGALGVLEALEFLVALEALGALELLVALVASAGYLVISHRYALGALFVIVSGLSPCDPLLPQLGGGSPQLGACLAPSEA